MMNSERFKRPQCTEFVSPTRKRKCRKSGHFGTGSPKSLAHFTGLVASNFFFILTYDDVVKDKLYGNAPKNRITAKGALVNRVGIETLVTMATVCPKFLELVWFQQELNEATKRTRNAKKIVRLYIYPF